ncbi:hypothetical protein OX90_11920 [Pseudomonas coronafaciens pv. porri]|uniref:Nucleotide modification associated domain-containing protein n=3 Tax=Pseudomonas TaxID=286 RepID=A0ABR5JPA1_9PSED|nr:hypothetical protein OX88_04540 [Pseudomonas coronafaciens pv. porri]KOP59348.1 hypothetical protein OX90_11920 [Pseudomonas coronafaciens pv. porri]
MPMNGLPRVYSYKLTRDYGFAPNPFHGICTLATCKPQIRRGAQVGDIVVGCGSAELNMVGKLIFMMRVSEKMTFQQYWDDPRFSIKKANLHASKAAAYGDNIYHIDNQQWIQEDSHHSGEDGVENPANLKRDLGSDNVLIGQDFVYWGSNAIDMPQDLRDLDFDDLYPDTRNYRSVYSDAFRYGVDAWLRAFPTRGYRGSPSSW